MLRLLLDYYLPTMDMARGWDDVVYGRGFFPGEGINPPPNI